jgi:hypothetical protein
MTTRLASVLYPNGQMSTYTYFGADTDHRLQTIHHQRPDTSTLSRFDYTYNPVGRILTWQQQADSAAPEVWHFRYDGGNQLVYWEKLSTGGTPAVLNRLAYSYDLAGNRSPNSRTKA